MPPASSFTPGGATIRRRGRQHRQPVALNWRCAYQHHSSTFKPAGFFNELWEFTGTSNYRAVAQRLGVGEASQPSGTTPVGRWGAVTWTDSGTGNLWLFGGQDSGLEFLNDLWSTTLPRTPGCSMPVVEPARCLWHAGHASASNLPRTLGSKCQTRYFRQRVGVRRIWLRFDRSRLFKPVAQRLMEVQRRPMDLGQRCQNGNQLHLWHARHRRSRQCTPGVRLPLPGSIILPISGCLVVHKRYKRIQRPVEV